MRDVGHVFATFRTRLPPRYSCFCALNVSASGIFFERGYSAHANPLLVLRPFASRPSTVPPRHMLLSVLLAYSNQCCDVCTVTHHIPPLPVPAL